VSARFLSVLLVAVIVLLWVGGLVFRPLSPLVLKVEYSVGHHNHAGVAEGFATSFPILF
jgi:hypothetical protein